MLNVIFDNLASRKIDGAISNVIASEADDYESTGLQLIFQCDRYAGQLPVESLRGLAWIIRLEHRYAEDIKSLAEKAFIRIYPMAKAIDPISANESLMGVTVYKNGALFNRLFCFRPTYNPTDRNSLDFETT